MSTLVEHVIREHEGLCRSVAGKYFAPGLTHDDLVQEARIGLWEAARDFQPDLGVPFGSFARLCITRQVQSAVVAANRRKHEPLNQSIAIDAPSNPADPSSLALADTLPGRDRGGVAERQRTREIHLFAAELGSTLTWLEDLAIAGLLEDRTYKDMAEQAGVTTKSIDNAIVRARRKATEIAERMDLDVRAAA